MRSHSGVVARIARTARTFALVFMIAMAVPAAVLAADPSPTAAAAGDPRSAGQGPGLVGDPLWAIGIVAAIAVLTLGACLIYLRATAARQRDRPS